MQFESENTEQCAKKGRQIVIQISEGWIYRLNKCESTRETVPPKITDEGKRMEYKAGFPGMV